MYVRKYAIINSNMKVQVNVIINVEFDNAGDNNTFASGTWLLESTSEANSTLLDSWFSVLINATTSWRDRNPSVEISSSDVNNIFIEAPSPKI